MKKTDLMTMTAAIALAASSCAAPDKTADEGPVIGRQEVTVENGRMTPEALWAMGRIGSSSVSPDGKRIAYTVSYYSVKENKGHTVIYVMNADGSDNRLLTTTAASESDPTWIGKGSKLAFLTGGQIWEMNPDGSERRQLSDVDGGVDGGQIFGQNIRLDGSMGTNVANEDLAQPSSGLFIQPNPAKESAVINFTCNGNGSQKANIDLIGMNGKVAATIYNGTVQAGENRIEWSRPSGLASGIYILRLSVGQTTSFGKLVLQ